MIRWFIKVNVLLGALALGWLGVQTWWLSFVCKTDPQTIACADLEAKGYGDNAHVHVTGLAFAHDFVWKLDGGKWVQLWVPVVAAAGADGRRIRAADQANVRTTLASFKVLVRTAKVPDQSAADKLKQRTDITGVVVNRIEALGADERKFLAASFPTADLDNVLILEEGRESPSATSGLWMLGSSAVVSLGALRALGLFRRRKQPEGDDKDDKEEPG